MPPTIHVIILFSVSLFAPRWITGQSFQENFEGPDLSAWNIISGEPILVDDIVFEGNQSCSMNSTMDNAETVMIHRTFSNNYGNYNFVARADEPDSDIGFTFQFLDGANFYFLSHAPIDGNNPQLSLQKVIDGNRTELFNGPAVANLGEWISVDIERTCLGDINVSIDDVLLISINDQDLREKGTIVLRANERTSYFDDITFTPDPLMNAGMRSIVTCSGSGFAFGDNVFTESTMFMDTIESTNGCDSIVEIDLQFVDMIVIDTMGNLCMGDTINIGDLQYTEPGSFSDTLMSANGCDSIINSDISLIETSGVDLGVDLTLCPGEMITLSLSNFQSYLWSDGSTESTFTIDVPGTYSVTVTDVNGCNTTDEILVTEGCDIEVGSANIFSPNGDMINDTWAPSLSQLPMTYELSIYDRYGNRVYFSIDPTTTWDGRFNNTTLNPGVYIWQLTVDDFTFQGDVTLIR